MLTGRLELHDVRDVERLCGHVITRSRLSLDHYDREAPITGFRFRFLNKASGVCSKLS